MKDFEVLCTHLKPKVYYNQYGCFYEGQELENYTYDGNYIQNVILNKFIIHYSKDRKVKYFCFNFSPVGKKKSYTFRCYNRLGVTYLDFGKVFSKKVLTSCNK